MELKRESADPVEVSSATEDILGPKEFLTATAAGGGANAVRLLAGLGRSKMAALLLGAAGVGLLAQAFQLQLFASLFGSLSMASGITQRVGAASARSQDEVRKVLSTAFSIQLLLCAFVVAAGVALRRPIATAMFGGHASPNLMIPIVLSVPFAVMVTSFFEGALVGIGRYDLYAKANSWSAVLSLAVFVPAVAFFGLAGAFYSILAAAIGSFLVFWWYARGCNAFEKAFTFGIDPDELGYQLKFAGTMFAVSAAAYATAAWTRSAIITNLGPRSNGILQVPLALTSYYTAFVMSGVSLRLQPAVSRMGDSKMARHALGSALEVVTLAGTICGLWILACDEIIIRTAYSSDFLEAKHLLPLYLFGNLLYFVWVSLGSFLLSISNLRRFFFGWLTYFALFCLMFAAAFSRKPEIAYPSAYVFASGILAAAGLWRIKGFLTGATFAVGLLCVAGYIVQWVLVRHDVSFVLRLALPVAATLAGFCHWRREAGRMATTSTAALLPLR